MLPAHQSFMRTLRTQIPSQTPNTSRPVSRKQDLLMIEETLTQKLAETRYQIAALTVLCQRYEDQTTIERLEQRLGDQDGRHRQVISSLMIKITNLQEDNRKQAVAIRQAQKDNADYAKQLPRLKYEIRQHQIEQATASRKDKIITDQKAELDQLRSWYTRWLKSNGSPLASPTHSADSSPAGSLNASPSDPGNSGKKPSPLPLGQTQSMFLATPKVLYMSRHGGSVKATADPFVTPKPPRAPYYQHQRTPSSAGSSHNSPQDHVSGAAITIHITPTQPQKVNP